MGLIENEAASGTAALSVAVSAIVMKDCASSSWIRCVLVIFRVYIDVWNVRSLCEVNILKFFLQLIWSLRIQFVLCVVY